MYICILNSIYYYILYNYINSLLYFFRLEILMKHGRQKYVFKHEFFVT